MSKPHLLQTGPMMGLIERATAEHFTVHKLHEAADREALLGRIGPDIVAISTGGHTGVKTDAALIARLPKLRIVANFGVGYDSIDVAAASARGIVVTNTPDVLTEEVADTALGLMLMTVRELGHAERWLRAGRWATDGDYRLTPASLRDRALGIVGMGRIGEAIATRAAAFGMPIAYHTRTPKAGLPYRYVPALETLARETDILMVITPGGPATKNLIDAKILAAVGANGILINMARGSVVDEPALLAALKARTILAAGLDVFWNEPKIDPAFLNLDNVVLLPHVGSASVWTRDKMGQLVADNLAAYATRARPLTPVPETPFNGW